MLLEISGEITPERRSLLVIYFVYVMCIYESQTPNLPLCPFPFGNHKFVFYVNLFLFSTYDHLYKELPKYSVSSLFYLHVIDPIVKALTILIKYSRMTEWNA